MKKSILLHPGMGESIVTHLSQFGNLPKTGVLAGQAVDSAITDLFGNGGGVYNDLDIFRIEERPMENRNVLRANEMAKRSRVTMVTDKHSYSHMNVLLSTVSTYNIHAVQRDEMLNTVSCVPTYPLRVLTPEMVIGGFDINCTRVAVDLATNRLVWDRDYEDFLHSRQLRISMMHTPWHTFLRLMKKAQELPGVYVNREIAAEACTAVSNSAWLSLMMQTSDVSMAFGKKNHELAERLESEWTPYFTLDSKTLYLGRDNKWAEDQKYPASSGKSVELWHMDPRGELSSVLQERCNRMGAGLLHYGAKFIEASHRKVGPAAYDKLNAIVAQQRAVLAQGAEHELGPHKPLLPDAITSENYGAYFVQANAELFGTDYVQGQALPVMASKLAEWLRQHKSMARMLVGLTLDEQYRRMHVISEACRECGKKYFNGDTQLGIGVLEAQAGSRPISSKEDVEAILSDYYQKNHSPFEVKPLPLPVAVPERFKGFWVTELLSPLALRNEGTLMGHCVGGYSDAVRTNRSRILAVRFQDERRTEDCSTVEVGGKFTEAPAKWNISVKQNYTAGNKRPSKRNQEFVDFLQAYLELAEVIEQCQESTPRRTAKRLMEEARRYESKTKRIIGNVSRLRKEQQVLDQRIAELQVKCDQKRSFTMAENYANALKLKELTVQARTHARTIDSVLLSLDTFKYRAQFLREVAPLQNPSAKAQQLVQDTRVSKTRAAVLEPLAAPEDNIFQQAA